MKGGGHPGDKQTDSDPSWAELSDADKVRYELERARSQPQATVHLVLAALTRLEEKAERWDALVRDDPEFASIIERDHGFLDDVTAGLVLGRIDSTE